MNLSPHEAYDLVSRVLCRQPKESLADAAARVLRGPLHPPPLNASDNVPTAWHPQANRIAMQITATKTGDADEQWAAIYDCARIAQRPHLLR